MVPGAYPDMWIVAMIRLGMVHDPILEAMRLKRWRCGRIVMRGGKLVQIEHRLFPRSATVAEVWWHTRFGHWQEDGCILDYHQPIGMRDFLTLDYIRCGRNATYRTFAGACHILDDIARTRGAKAIVTNVTNESISDRFLQRMGWERHLEHWRGRHWIKRFYDGYPERTAARYLPAA